MPSEQASGVQQPGAGLQSPGPGVQTPGAGDAGNPTVVTLGEHALIARIRQRLGPAPDWLVVDVGDDAAVYEPARNRLEVITTDAIVDGVHFDRRFVPAEAIGHRAVAVNLSDLAAMGATPRLLTLSLALPDDVSLDDFDRLVDGAIGLAERAGARRGWRQHHAHARPAGRRRDGDRIGASPADSATQRRACRRLRLRQRHARRRARRPGLAGQSWWRRRRYVAGCRGTLPAARTQVTAWPGTGTVACGHGGRGSQRRAGRWVGAARHGPRARLRDRGSCAADLGECRARCGRRVAPMRWSKPWPAATTTSWRSPSGRRKRAA